MSDPKAIIEENLQTKSPVLDLGKCGLDGTEDDLYDLLKDTDHLDTLIFSNIWYEFDKKEQRFTDCQSKNQGDNNKLIKIPEPLPTSIRKLLIAGEESNPWPLKDISPLSKLKYLVHLDISNSNVDDLSNLVNLVYLLELNLSKSYVKDISPLADESRMVADVALPKWFVGALIGSAFLGLGPIGALIGGPFVSKLISPLFDKKDEQTQQSKQIFLHNLNISDTKVKDVEPLAKITNLSYLSLSDTPIKDITSLTSLKKLRGLDISNTSIQIIPPELVFLSELKVLRLDNTPLKKPPLELAQNGLEAIRDYYQKIEQKKDFWEKDIPEFDDQRKKDLRSKIEESYDLLSKWEEKYQLAENPNEELRAKKQIEKLKKLIEAYREELRQLTNRS